MKMSGLFGWKQPADGASPALEAVATGINLDTINVQTAVGSGRRERNANDGSAVIEDALSVKLMHGWLQNRHQTLLPLTLNVATLPTARRAALARTLACFLLAGRSGAEAREFAPVLRTWLSSVGGDAEALSAFDDALMSPLPLNVVFDDAQALDLTIYAYVAALMASDSRYPVSVLLCDLVQARFDLPSTVIRSAVRRYRR